METQKEPLPDQEPNAENNAGDAAKQTAGASAKQTADTGGSDGEPLYSGPSDRSDLDSEPSFLAYISPSFWD